LIPKIDTGQRHQFFIGGDNRLLLGDGAFNNLARDTGSADQFGDDVNVGMVNHFVPVGGAVRGYKGCRNMPLGHAAAAQSHHAQRKAEFLRNQLVVLREDVQSPEADVSEADDADVDGFHGNSMIAHNALLLHD
jgi:hypothetical protein